MIKLNETVYLDFTVRNPKTMSNAVPDYVTAKIYAGGSSSPMVYTPNVTPRSGIGEYQFAIICTSGNGFSIGQMYNVYVTATFGSITQSKCIATFGITMWSWDDLGDEAFGKWILDKDNNTLTLYKSDGITVLRTFSLSSTQDSVPAYITRTPV